MEQKSENAFNRNVRTSSSYELPRNLNCDEDEEDTDYNCFVAKKESSALTGMHELFLEDGDTQIVLYVF